MRTYSLSLKSILLGYSIHRLSSLLIGSFCFLTNLFPCLTAVLTDLYLSHLLSRGLNLISFFLTEKKEGRSVSPLRLNLTCSQYLRFLSLFNLTKLNLNIRCCFTFECLNFLVISCSILLSHVLELLLGGLIESLPHFTRSFHELIYSLPGTLLSQLWHDAIFEVYKGISGFLDITLHFLWLLLHNSSSSTSFL